MHYRSAVQDAISSLSIDTLLTATVPEGWSSLPKEAADGRKKPRAAKSYLRTAAILGLNTIAEKDETEAWDIAMKNRTAFVDSLMAVCPLVKPFYLQ